jgi:hypothetical protein
VREAGALRRTPLARRARGPALRTALALLGASLLAAALAGPNLFAGTVYKPCPDAVLPMRMGAFQPQPDETLDVAAWLALDEFKESRAWVSVRGGASPITFAVFAYVGSLAETMIFEITKPDGAVTWRTEVALDPPDAGVTTLTFYPYYALITVEPASWRRIFPTAGPYLLRASRPATPSPYSDAFCGAETTSWVLVVR